MGTPEEPIGMPWSEWAQLELDTVDGELERYTSEGSSSYEDPPRELVDRKDTLLAWSYAADLHDDLQRDHPGVHIPFPANDEGVAEYMERLSVLEKELGGDK